MGKLEKVSEDPELREEMEKEVGSTNSAVVAAAAGWARSVILVVTLLLIKEIQMLLFFPLVGLSELSLPSSTSLQQVRR